MPSIVQQAYLKASNAEAGDLFGYAVSVSGDTAIVGANESSNANGVNGDQTNNSALQSGAAYVFARNGTTWGQQAYLKASNTEAGDLFGYSVAVSGDTVVVGAYRESSNATGVNGDQTDNSSPAAGAAYVFVRSGTTWAQQAYLKASNTGPGDFFGYSVAISGDTVVVGASEEDSNSAGANQNNRASAGRSGAAYVFVRSGTNWSQQAYLKASNSAAGHKFGWSVAMSGDTIVVGAPFESAGSALSGAAYVFVRHGTTWIQQAYLKASNAGTSDLFGYSVSVSEDTMVVGAHGESSSAVGVNGNQDNNDASGAGAAYVFVRTGTNWSQQAYLKASNTGTDDAFGISVAAASALVVVGALGESSNATGVNGDETNDLACDSGAAYAFVRSGTTWTQRVYLKASNTDTNDYFGHAVAVSGDTVLVGASGESSNAIGVNGDQSDNSFFLAGAAYLFTGFAPPPPLAIEHSAGAVRVFWPAPATGCVLEEVSALNASPVTAWTQVPFPYQTNATHISVTVPMPAASKFYRLRKP